MLAWQSTQALLPTAWAPSIRGGSTTTRSGVEQELSSSSPAPTSARTAVTANHRQVFIGEQSM
jgi:hypothetical protein